MGDTKAARGRHHRRIAVPARASMAPAIAALSRSNQTTTDKSPHFAATKRGENAACRATKQIHAMQKRAV
jgi:hypothetical protein